MQQIKNDFSRLMFKISDVFFFWGGGAVLFACNCLEAEIDLLIAWKFTRYPVAETHLELGVLGDSVSIEYG